MKLGHIGALAAAISIGLPAPVVAQPASMPAAARPSPKAEALVRRLFVALQLEQQMRTMLDSMVPVMMESMARQTPGITTEQRQMVGDAAREAMREIFPRMMDRFVPVYAETFSVQDLEALVAFYESPPGRSFISKQPQLGPKGAEIMRSMMPEVQAEMLKRMCMKIDCSGAAAPPKARPS